MRNEAGTKMSETRAEALLQATRAEPDDDACRLAYSD
jgi:hypothetical protein